MEKINCHNCNYYYITWDERFPYGCKFFNFKGKIIPSLYVFHSSGKECQFFMQKKPRREEKKEQGEL